MTQKEHCGNLSFLCQAICENNLREGPAVVIFPYLTTDEPHHIGEGGSLFISINPGVKWDLTEETALQELSSSVISVIYSSLFI